MRRWFVSLDWKTMCATLICGVVLLLITKAVDAVTTGRSEERYRELLLATISKASNEVHRPSVRVETISGDASAQTMSLASYCDMQTAIGRQYFLLGVEQRHRDKEVRVMAVATFMYAIDRFERCVRAGGEEGFLDSAMANIYMENKALSDLAHWVHPYPEDAVLILNNVVSNRAVRSSLRKAALEFLEILYKANPKLRQPNPRDTGTVRDNIGKGISR